MDYEKMTARKLYEYKLKELFEEDQNKYTGMQKIFIKAIWDAAMEMVAEEETAEKLFECAWEIEAYWRNIPPPGEMFIEG